MIGFFYILVAMAGVLLAVNILLYQRNVSVEHWDAMGTGSLFSGLFAISMVLVAVGLLLHPGLNWYYALFPILGVPLGPPVLRPVVHGILRRFGLADRSRET